MPLQDCFIPKNYNESNQVKRDYFLFVILFFLLGLVLSFVGYLLLPYFYDSPLYSFTPMIISSGIFFFIMAFLFATFVLNNIVMNLKNSFLNIIIPSLFIFIGWWAVSYLYPPYLKFLGGGHGVSFLIFFIYFFTFFLFLLPIFLIILIFSYFSVKLSTSINIFINSLVVFLIITLGVSLGLIYNGNFEKCYSDDTFCFAQKAIDSKDYDFCDAYSRSEACYHAIAQITSNYSFCEKYNKNGYVDPYGNNCLKTIFNYCIKIKSKNDEFKDSDAIKCINQCALYNCTSSFYHTNETDEYLLLESYTMNYCRTKYKFDIYGFMDCFSNIKFTITHLGMDNELFDNYFIVTSLDYCVTDWHSKFDYQLDAVFSCLNETIFYKEISVDETFIVNTILSNIYNADPYKSENFLNTTLKIMRQEYPLLFEKVKMCYYNYSPEKCNKPSIKDYYITNWDR